MADTLYKRDILFSELLLLAGADVNAAGYKDTPLYNALICQNKVELILNAGADVNMQTGRKKETALHVAVRFGELDIVRLLLKYGARLDITDKDGRTPLDVAREKRNDAIVELLQNWKKDEHV